MLFNRALCLDAREEVPCQTCLCDWTTAVTARYAEPPFGVPLHLPSGCKLSTVTRTRVAFGFRDAFIGMRCTNMVVKVINPLPIFRLLCIRTVRAALMHAYYGDLTCIGLTISLCGIWYIVRR